MSANYDDYILNASQNAETADFIFRDRQFIDVPDANGGSYTSNQITFDLSNIANNNMCVDWKSSYMHIPLTAIVNSAGFANESAFMLSLKNGNYQLIHSFSVMLSNTGIIEAVPFSNIPITYKLLTSFSASDQDLLGPSINFYKDDWQSTKYSATYGDVNTNVVGVNSKQLTTVATNLSAVTANTGRLQRMINGPSCLAGPGTGIAGDATVNACLAPATFNSVQRSSCLVSSATLVCYVIQAIIPMRFLHDFFEKCPLMRSAYYKFTVNTNANCSVALTTAITTGVTTAVAVTSPNNVIPFQLTPTTSGAGTGGIINATAASSVVATMSIGGPATMTGLAGAQIAVPYSNPQKACRLIMAMYQFSPIQEENYFKDRTIQKITFNDYMACTPTGLMNIAPGNPVANVSLVPSMSKMRRLIIVPYLAASNNTLTLSPLNSPFSCCPATTAPCAYVSGFNVSLSGKNIYQNNISYNYDQFLHENLGVNSINGNGVIGMSAGLISEADFNSCYGYITVNLQRHAQENDNANTSLSVSWTNMSKLTMNYYAFIEYEKEINVDILKGQLVVA